MKYATTDQPRKVAGEAGVGLRERPKEAAPLSPKVRPIGAQYQLPRSIASLLESVPSTGVNFGEVRSGLSQQFDALM